MAAQPSEVGFKDAHFAELFEWEAGHFWFRTRNRLILWALARFAPRPDARYLEIGCGTGYVLDAVERHFPAYETAGSEMLEEGLRHARQRVRRSRLFQLDARAMEEQAAYDVIGAFDVLEHIEEDREVLSQLHRALRGPGLLLLTVPQHRFLWSAADEYACHARRYERAELVGKVEAAGFTVQYVSSFVTLLLPLMVLSRARRGPYDPAAEFRLPRWLNRLFERVLDVERFFLERGLSLPVGGSLLLAARKEPA